jgi:NTP pyrophosphatase (non-canonical NTP hydrolase)
MTQKQTLFEAIREVSALIKDRRQPYQVMAKQMEELGEMATEINISQGYMKRAPGKDGVVGEGADVLVTTIDQILLASPYITEDELVEIVTKKLSKWLNYYTTNFPNITVE